MGAKARYQYTVEFKGEAAALVAQPNHGSNELFRSGMP